MRRIKTICVVLVVVLSHGNVYAQFLELDVSENYISNYLDSAAGLPSDYDQLVAAMVAKYHEHDSLSLFLNQEFSDPNKERLRLSLIIEYCSEENTYTFCNSDPIGSLIAIDPDNFIPYLIMASSLLRIGEDSKALAIIETGLQAWTVNDYYLEKLALVRNELSTKGYPSDKLNLASEGYPGAVYSYGFYNYLLNTCREKSGQDNAWAVTCFSLGAKLENFGNSWGNVVFGSSIQRDVLQVSDPDSAALPAILARREYYNEIRDKLAEAFDWWLDDTLVRKPDWFYREAIEFGELRGLERALERASN